MTVEELLEQYGKGKRDFSGLHLQESNLSRVNLSGADLSHADLSVANLSGANLAGVNLSHARMNVTRLSSANLNRADMSYANLNVANLTRADLRRAKLVQASLVQAEMVRSDLSEADLSQASLNRCDLRESRLQKVNLTQAILTEADLRGSSLVSANLDYADLRASDLSYASLSGASLRDTEFRHANLQRSNLSGANLSGANLRWVDLSGANLCWADLSNTKLSGANLVGADLSNANLINASLVHADLTQTNLTGVEWMGADLSGAILTGSRLYGVSRFGLKTDNMICDWVDLSELGDRTLVRRFNVAECREFFNETPPTIYLMVDASLDAYANYILASIYHQISQHYPVMAKPPVIEITQRRTTLTFRLTADHQLFPTACLAILPFQDAKLPQAYLQEELNKIGEDGPISLTAQQVQEWQVGMTSFQLANKLGADTKLPDYVQKLPFFQAPIELILTNSRDKVIQLYQHPNFGKRLVNAAGQVTVPKPITIPRSALPSSEVLRDFINGFRYSV